MTRDAQRYRKTYSYFRVRPNTDTLQVIVDESLDWKPSARAASTTNQALTGAGLTLSFGGITAVDEDRLLLKDQTDPKENGIYYLEVDAGASTWQLTRASDCRQGTLSCGAAVYIEEGTSAGTLWIMSTVNPIDIGVASLTWTQLVTGGAGTAPPTYFSSSINGSIFTSGSAAFIGNGDEWGVIESPLEKGTDVFFYVSGSTTAKSLFGGDTVVSGVLETKSDTYARGALTVNGIAYLGNTNVYGALNGIDSGESKYVFDQLLGSAKFKGVVTSSSGFSGSLTRLPDGSSYLIAGSNVTITSASNGAVTISSAGGGSGPQYFSSTTAGAVYTTGSAAFVGAEGVDAPDDKGADVFFYVSGSQSSKDGAIPGVALFGGDVVISGTLHGGSPLKIGTNTQITGTFSQGFAAHAIGVNSHAQGYQSIAEGVHSHAAGIGGYAFGSGSYAAGSSTKWGLSSTAWGEGSHAEGLSTTAVGIGSHAEGERTVTGEPFLNFTMTAGDTTIYITGVDATSRYTGDTLVIRSDIGVNYTVTYSGGPSYDSVNNWTVLTLDYSFDNATVSGDVVDVSHSTGAHAEGMFTKAMRAGSHAEGATTEAIGSFSHAEGNLTSAQGAASHAEGASTAAIGINSHAEGFGSYVTGFSAHGEGDSGVAGGTSSHSEGSGTKAMGDKSHAEGTITHALGVSTHAEGYDTTAGFAWMTGSISAGVLTLPGPDFQGPPGYSPNDSFGVIIDDSLDDNVFERTVCDIASWTTVGPNNDVVITLSNETRSSTKVYAGYMVAGMGYGALSHVYGTALDEAAHAEGLETVAAGIGSHAQGYLTLAAGKHSHAEGYLTVAIGSGSHAAGSGSIARGPYSYAGGHKTITSGAFQTAVGTYNVRGNTSSLFVVGNGTGDINANRSDILRVNSDSVQVTGSLSILNTAAISQVVSTSEDFDTTSLGSLPSGWTTDGNANWAVSNSDAYTSTQSVQAGTISDSQSTNLRYSVNLTSYSRAQFAWKVSSELNYDFLRFYIDNVLQNSISGLGGWSQITSSLIAPGSHELRWTYSKDSSAAGGSDTGWVDNFQLTNTSDFNDVLTVTSSSTTRANVRLEAGIVQARDALSLADLLAHAQGEAARAYGTGSFAHGRDVLTTGDYSHAQGTGSIGSGFASHAEGYKTTASGLYAHVEGESSIASGQSSHAEGLQTSATNYADHAEGYATTASGGSSHAEGDRTDATNQYAHSEGSLTTASGYASHAEGYQTIALGTYSHAEGWLTIASGLYAHAEGSLTVATGAYSHSEGFKTAAFSTGSHAEGFSTTGSGDFSHAEGWLTIASGFYAHAEGGQTTALGVWSHAEGTLTIASGTRAHAEGRATTAFGAHSHSEGSGSLSYGEGSHAEGLGSISFGSYSSAAGLRTISSGSYQAVVGKYNKRDNVDSLFVVGNGTADADINRSDVLRVNSDSVQVTGSLVSSLGLSGSLTKLSDGSSYLIAGSNVTITSASNGAVTISSTGGGGSSAYTLNFLAGTFTSAEPSSSMGSVGMDYLDSTLLPGSTYTFKAVLATTAGTTAYMDLYDYNGIIGGTPGPISGSVVTGSSQSYTYLSKDISTAMAAAVGSGIIEARIWCTPTGSSLNAICKSAKLVVT